MNRKNRLKQLIHIAKADLGLDDGTYRAILEAQIGKTSTTKMTIAELDAVLKHLKSKGFKVKSGSKTKKKAGKLKQADDPQSKKIRSLWLELHQLGAVRDSSEKALANYVKRITKTSALQFLSTAQASTVIESLKQWLNRIEKT